MHEQTYKTNVAYYFKFFFKSPQIVLFSTYDHPSIFIRCTNYEHFIRNRVKRESRVKFTRGQPFQGAGIINAFACQIRHDDDALCLIKYHEHINLLIKINMYVLHGRCNGTG